MKRVFKSFAFACAAMICMNSASAQNVHIAEYNVSEDNDILNVKFAGLGNSTWNITLNFLLEESMICQKIVELGNGDENIINLEKSTTGTAVFNPFQTTRNGHSWASAAIQYSGGKLKCPNENSEFVMLEGSYNSSVSLTNWSAVKL